jgi:hypothetical protein
MSSPATCLSRHIQTRTVFQRLGGVLCVSLLLGACGGGGSNSTKSTPPPVGPSLSASQAAFQSFALSQNGGMHYVLADLIFTNTGSGIVVNPSSVFFTQNISIPASPSTGPQPFTISLSSLVSNLAPPAPAAPGRYMVAGSVYVAAAPPAATVTYPGINVQTAYLAANGKTVVYATLGTSYVVTPLSGLVSASPGQIFSGSNLGIITNSINGMTLYSPQSTWNTGSAFITIFKQFAGDTLEVDDCADPATTGTSVTACSSSTALLTAFFPFTDASSGITYQFTDGQVQTVAGVTAWVSTASVPNRPTTSYRVFYEASGQIFGGYLIKEGTAFAIDPLGGGAPQDFEILFNEAAVQSIEGAVTF